MDDLDRLIRKLPEAEQQAISARRADLMTGNTLRELRILAGRTQGDVSPKTGTKQAGARTITTVNLTLKPDAHAVVTIDGNLATKR